MCDDRSVIAEYRRKDQCVKNTFDLDRLAALVNDIALGSVSAALNIVFLITVIDDFDCHLILCESTCLIRADNVNAAQSLNSKKSLYDRVALSHLCHTYRKNDSDDCRQTFRNSCDCE